MTPAAVVAAGVLHGVVTIGPLTPVCRVGTPCDGPARNAVLTFARAGGHPAVVHTDAAGVYRVRLRTGTYTVHASVGMSLRPAVVAVRAGSRRVDFAIDTGIR
jgi:hypothetical protein